MSCSEESKISGNKFSLLLKLSEKMEKLYSQKLEEELKKLKVFPDWDTGSENEIIFN